MTDKKDKSIAADTSAIAARELIFLNEHPIEKLPKLR